MWRLRGQRFLPPLEVVCQHNSRAPSFVIFWAPFVDLEGSGSVGYEWASYSQPISPSLCAQDVEVAAPAGQTQCHCELWPGWFSELLAGLSLLLWLFCATAEHLPASKSEAQGNTFLLMPCLPGPCVRWSLT